MSRDLHIERVLGEEQEDTNTSYIPEYYVMLFKIINLLFMTTLKLVRCPIFPTSNFPSISCITLNKVTEFSRPLNLPHQ